MLVEDDKSLREIYGVRLLAEGYDIVSAGDGEEALAIAIKERPALIVTDVMMPKISGFDMLDILRSTTETKNIKVILMTALSSEDHRIRGEQMGADRYLVKSQVGIEDVVRVVHEVLGDAPAPQLRAAPAVTATPAPAPTLPPAPAPSTAAVAPAPPATQQPPALPATPVQAPTQATATPYIPAGRQTVSTAAQVSAAAGPPAGAQQPQARPQQQPAPQQPAQAQSSTTPAAPSTRQRVIEPINDPSTKVDIQELLDRELARESGVGLGTPAAPPASVEPLGQIPTTAQEKAMVSDQIDTFALPTPPSPAASGVPPVSINQQGRVNAPAPAPQQPTPPPAQPFATQASVIPPQTPPQVAQPRPAAPTVPQAAPRPLAPPVISQPRPDITPPPRPPMPPSPAV